MSSASAPTQYLRPTATDRVRLTVGELELLAAVVETDDTHVTLDLTAPTEGTGTILFSHPRGVVELTGSVGPHAHGLIFTITDQRRLEQRRGAFRLVVTCPVNVVRRDGHRLEARTGDLSVTGVRLLDATELHDDELVDLEIVLDDGTAVELAGQVVRRGDDNVGVTFHDLPSAAEAQLSRFVSEAQRRRLRPADL